MLCCCAGETLVSNLDEEDWSAVPFYVVGTTTGNVLRKMPVSPFTPSSQNIIGEGSGTGESLAELIIGDQGGRAAKLPLLYLTGDKNRDGLPKLVRAGGLDLEPLQVYGTRGSQNFSMGVKELFQHHVPLGECDSRPHLKGMDEIDRDSRPQILLSGGLCSLPHRLQSFRCRSYGNTLPFPRSMGEKIKRVGFAASQPSGQRRRHTWKRSAG